MTIRARVAELLRTVAKDNPTGSSLHVPVPLGDDDKKKRRRRAASTLTKAASDVDGTYVGRMVVNEAAWRAWWASARQAGEPDMDANMHVTVAYSRAGFDWQPDQSYIVVPPSSFIGFQTLGADKAVVLMFESLALERCWAETRAAGATWDHDGFKPHTTLFFLGAGYPDVYSQPWRSGGDSVPTPPDIPLVLGPELVGPRGVDVFQVANAPSWYVPPVRAGA